MGSFNRFSFTTILLVAAMHTQAQQVDTVGIAAAYGEQVPGNPGTTIDTSYGTARHQAQYAISELLAAVTADVSAQLEDFLGRDLQRVEREAATVRSREERLIVSAH